MINIYQLGVEISKGNCLYMMATNKNILITFPNLGNKYYIKIGIIFR